MRIPISVKNKAMNLESKLVTLDSLTGIGYNLQGSKHVLSKGPAGESYEFLLSGDNDVSVEFTFYPEFEEKGDYVIIYVVDDKTDKDFSLDSWMQMRRGASRESPFKLASYSGEYEQQITGFLKFVNSLFYEAELRAVLEGKAWLDVKFNWGDAK